MYLESCRISWLQQSCLKELDFRKPNDKTAIRYFKLINDLLYSSINGHYMGGDQLMIENEVRNYLIAREEARREARKNKKNAVKGGNNE